MSRLYIISVAIFSVGMLILPSVHLILPSQKVSKVSVLGWHYNGAVIQRSPLNYTTKNDPLGAVAALSILKDSRSYLNIDDPKDLPQLTRTDELNRDSSLAEVNMYVKNYNLDGHWANIKEEKDFCKESFQRTLIFNNEKPQTLLVHLATSAGYTYVFNPQMGFVIYSCKSFWNSLEKAYILIR